MFLKKGSRQLNLVLFSAFVIACFLQVEGGAIDRNETAESFAHYEYCESEIEEGTTWKKHCDDAAAMCILNKKQDGPTCQCTDNTKFYDIDSKVCKDYCESEIEKGKTWEKHCADEAAICILNKNQDGPTCMCNDKTEFYDFDSNVCKVSDLCSFSKIGKESCGRLNRVCHPSEADPFFECGECLPNHIDNGGKCIDFCAEGEIGEHTCKVQYMECISSNTSPFFRCMGCLEGFDKIHGKCIVSGFCTNDSSSKRVCDHQNKICSPMPFYPFYRCKQCKDGYEVNGKNCIGYCASGSSSKKECDQRNKICDTVEFHPFYKCENCKDGFEENRNECVGICDDNSTSRKKCMNLNRKCERVYTYPFYRCGNCEDGLQEIAGLCVKEKKIKDINQLMLFLIKTKRTSEETQFLFYDPRNGNVLNYTKFLK